MNLIKSFKITIYNTKYTNNTKLHFQKSNWFNTSSFSKTRHSQKVFYVESYGTINISYISSIIIVAIYSYMLRATQPN